MNQFRNRLGDSFRVAMSAGTLARKRLTRAAAAGAFILSAAAVGIVPLAEAAKSPRVGANYPLRSSGATAADPDVPGLAVDPRHPNHIVEANINPLDLQCDYHVSYDGGRSWTGGHLRLPHGSPSPGSAPFPSPACNQNFDSGGYAHLNTGVVFGSGENVYITFSIHRGAFNRPESNFDGGEGDDAVVAHSVNGGRTFRRAVIAVFGGGPISAHPGLAGYGMRPQIAVQPRAGTGGRDRLYVDSWNCYIRVRASQTERGGCSGGGGDRRIFVARSDDAGATWHAPVLVSAAGVRSAAAALEAGSPDEQATEPSQPVVGPDGAVYVAYKNRDITDGTTCPANPSITGKAGGFTRTKADCVVVARSTDHGLTWSRVSVQPYDKGTSLVNPRLAIDRRIGSRGRLYVVYQAKIGSDPVDIRLQSSTDGGQTWSSPTRVNDDPPGNVQTNPWVTVDSRGTVSVVWFDKRLQYPGGGNLGDVYLARSTNGGASFGTNRRVTDRSINIDTGRYGDFGDDFSQFFDWYGPVAAPLPNGGLLTAWTDSRVGNNDDGFQNIFFARFDPRARMGQSEIAAPSMPGLSVLLSRMAFPGGEEAVAGSPVTKVVVVNQRDVAAALAGAVLARANWGPLLLSPAKKMPGAVRREAGRLTPEGGFVIGGTRRLSNKVLRQLRHATRNRTGVVRVAAAGNVAAQDRPAEIARQVAELMRPPSFQAPTSPPEAVIVNPATAQAASASALAAALELPILFVDRRHSLPGPTASAISSLGIKKALIVGGNGAVNPDVQASLVTMLGAANVRRLGGANASATSRAVFAEARRRGLPVNVVYVADARRPIEGALLGAAVARVNGGLLLMSHPRPRAIEGRLRALGVATAVDRIVRILLTP